MITKVVRNMLVHPRLAYVSQRITCHEMGHQFNASHTFKLQW